MTRRAIVAGSVALGWHGTALGRSGDGLKDRAARRGLAFGAAVTTRSLREDEAFRDAILRECAVLVPEYEMKWGQIERKRGARDYAASDWLVDFAARNGMSVRGHTAIWYRNLPGWVEGALAGPEGGSVVDGQVRALLGHFGDRITDWDVVNEVIEPRDAQPGDRRNTVFLRNLGPGYVAAAFRAARAVHPKAQLVYNDYDLEYDLPAFEKRRRATLALLRDLRAEGLVDALGIQSHLRVGRPFAPAIFRRFLADVAGLGLTVLLTEFDVNDTMVEAAPAVRDKAVAEHAARFLDTALDEKAVTAVVAWGLSDRYTWLNVAPFARKDGERSRGLPLDDAMQRKPLWEAMARAFADAPDRRPRGAAP